MSPNHLLFALGALLVTLKLGFIAPSSIMELSWWLVLLPFYAGYAISLGLIGLIIAATIAVAVVTLIAGALFYGGVGLVWLVAMATEAIRSVFTSRKK